jgi:hypothetical protein
MSGKILRLAEIQLKWPQPKYTSMELSDWVCMASHGCLDRCEAEELDPK